MCVCVCCAFVCVGVAIFERIEYMLINERRSGLNLMISPSKTPFKLLQSILQYVRMLQDEISSGKMPTKCLS